MGLGRLPRDREGMRKWARRLTVGRSVPPYPLTRVSRQTLAQGYQHLYWLAFEAGARAALEEVFSELERPDDPLAGLPPHLVKSAQAGARGHARRRAGKEKGEAA